MHKRLEKKKERFCKAMIIGEKVKANCPVRDKKLCEYANDHCLFECSVSEYAK
jgi:hypothetical protein